MESDQHLVKGGVHLDYKVVRKKIRFRLVLPHKEGHRKPLIWTWISREFQRKVRVFLGHPALFFLKKKKEGRWEIYLVDRPRVEADRKKPAQPDCSPNPFTTHTLIHTLTLQHNTDIHL